MIVGPVISSGAPGAAGVLAGAFLWVLSMMILLFHRSGMQVLGGAIAMMGLMMLLVNVHLFLSLMLLAFGFGVHGCGRLLVHMRRRQ